MTDVVVVGAGVVGAATAFHLARAGARVTVVDKAGVAAGSTGLSAGFVRVHQEDRALAALSAAGLAEFAAWESVVGLPSTFVRTGCVYVCDDGPLDAGALVERYPGVAWPEGLRAVWEPDAGYADPLATTEGYLQAAGVDVTVAAARSLSVAGGRVTGVVTDGGVLPAGQVVVATGAWAARSGLLPGPVPVRTRRILWQRDRGLPSSGVPCYVDEGAGRLYFRPEAGGGARFGAGCDEWEVDPDAPAVVDPALVAVGRERVGARLRVPPPEDSEVLAGFDGYTADGRPIVGAWPEVDGLYVALAFSGGGFKTAPAVGRLLTTLMTTGTTDPLLAPFAPAPAAPG